MYIGGAFDGIGSHSYSNFVKFKAGSFDSPLPNMPPVGAMITNGSTIFYASAHTVTTGQNLPIGYYSKDREQLDYFRTIPIVNSPIASVSAFAIYGTQIFVGGAFNVTLPSGGYANAVTYYDLSTGMWYSVNIPDNIGQYYEINSISVAPVADESSALYLTIGGKFSFTDSSQTQHFCLAVLNLGTGAWVPVSDSFNSYSIINQVIIDEIENVYIAGNLDVS